MFLSSSLWKPSYDFAIARQTRTLDITILHASLSPFWNQHVVITFMRIPGCYSIQRENAYDVNLYFITITTPPNSLNILLVIFSVQFSCCKLLIFQSIAVSW